MSAPNPYDAGATPTRAVWMVGDVPIPVIEVPPEIPLSIPVAGPVIKFIGEGEHAIWDNVFGWVKHTAGNLASDIKSIETTVANAVLNTVETWVGQTIQALSGFINQAFDFTAEIGYDLFSGAVDLAGYTFDEIDGLWSEVLDILANVAGIDNIVIPGLEGLIQELANATGNLVDEAVRGLQRWAIDNIYHPLLVDLVQTAGWLETDIHDGLTRVLAEAEALVHSEAVARAAAIAGVAAAAAAITSWVDDCGEPMCQVIGPKTDLGKWLKALSLAESAALLAELANAKESDVENAVRGIAAMSTGIVDQINTMFVTGGATVGETVAGLHA